MDRESIILDTDYDRGYWKARTAILGNDHVPGTREVMQVVIGLSLDPDNWYLWGWFDAACDIAALAGVVHFPGMPMRPCKKPPERA